MAAFNNDVLNRWRGGRDDPLREFRSLAPERVYVVVLIQWPCTGAMREIG